MSPLPSTSLTSKVASRPSKDRRKFTMLWSLPRPESILYVSLVSVINSGQFWSLKRCAECSRFFLGKRRYCSDACLRNHNSKTAQQRVERLRTRKRFDQVFPKLLKLQNAVKGTSQLELLGKLPGFSPALLADIIGGKRPLKTLAAEVKYKNRKILLEAKL